MWEPRVLQRLGRLAAHRCHGSHLEQRTRGARRAAAADFEHAAPGGFRSQARHAVGRAHATASRTKAAGPTLRRHNAIRWSIVGAGLAGAACAHALARLGVRSRVIDTHPAVAAGRLGTAGRLAARRGAPDDSPHTRWFRAARAARARGDRPADRAAARCAARSTACCASSASSIARRCSGCSCAQGLPPDYVQALSPD